MRNKNIVKSIAFLIGLLILLGVISFFFMTNDSIKAGTSKKARNILNEPKNTLDYLAIGDSECDMSISPMEIWKKYGYTGYNCGMKGQRLQETYYFLDDLLENQSPKVVLMETNEFFRDSSEELQNTFDGIMEQTVPIFKNHDVWKFLSVGKQDTAANALKGLNCNTGVKPYKKGYYIKATQKAEDMNIFPLYYLNKIVSLCKEKKINLILFSSPSPVCWTYAKHNSAAAFARKNGLPYLDLNLCADAVGIDWSKDTFDKGNHVNFSGAVKVTNYLGEYLSAHCNLTDHRKEEKYAFWNKEFDEYVIQIKLLIQKNSDK